MAELEELVKIEITKPLPETGLGEAGPPIRSIQITMDVVAAFSPVY